jgi:predicted N-acetyltransferase YhbS
MKPTIRSAGPEDAEAMLPTYRSGLELHVAARPDTFKPASDDELAQGIRRLITTEHNRFFVAEVADTIVGYVSVVARERLVTPISVADTWLELDQISVLPEHQRSGVGHALVEHVIEEARATGLLGLQPQRPPRVRTLRLPPEVATLRAMGPGFELAMS